MPYHSSSTQPLDVLNPLRGPASAAGPLVVSTINPRYFAIGSGCRGDRLVYLTGSHINNNFHDGMGPGSSCVHAEERFDYDAYISFLKDHGHNFIRLWRWELVKSQLAGGRFHFCSAPQPWRRTGKEAALDGKPKFDLSRFDAAYFQRLRDRVLAAGSEGIYVAVMLFDGFGLHLSALPDNVEGHPFHAGNNINGIGISSVVDYQVLPLDPCVRTLQEAYVRKVLDTLHDLPNVLYEVANESSGDTGDSVTMPDGSSIATPIGDSTEWQYWVVEFVKQYERSMGYDQHPVGMTMQYPVPDQRKVNEPLFRSCADWVSPGFDQPAVRPGGTPPPGRWLSDPPPNDGTKVVLSDTDHYASFKGDVLWAWKSFLRGHNPVFYDFGMIEGMNQDPSLEPIRHSMGETRRFAERIGLADMTPRGDLSTTRYALANPGQEYLVLQPGESDDPFTLTVDAGVYAVEWYNVNGRETVGTDTLTVDNQVGVTFKTAVRVAGPAVLYLKRL